MEVRRGRLLLVITLLCAVPAAVHAQGNNGGKGGKGGGETGQCFGGTKVTDPLDVVANFNNEIVLAGG